MRWFLGSCLEGRMVIEKEAMWTWKQHQLLWLCDQFHWQFDAHEYFMYLWSSVFVQICQMQVPLKACLALDPCSVQKPTCKTWLDVMQQRTSASVNEDSPCKMVYALVSMLGGHSRVIPKDTPVLSSHYSFVRCELCLLYRIRLSCKHTWNTLNIQCQEEDLTARKRNGCHLCM